MQTGKRSYVKRMRVSFLFPSFAGVGWVMFRSALHLAGLRLLSPYIYQATDFGGESYFFDRNDTSRIAVALQPDLTPQLPEGGILYRLGDIHKSKKNVRSSRSLRIRRSDRNTKLTWDLLWSDFRGAFDQDFLPSDGLYMNIPWREPHEPLFLVVYAGNRSDVKVEYVEGEHVTYDPEVMAAFDFPRRDLFYRKRSGTGGKVTLCTQITPERLRYLFHIVTAWNGPVSAVIYVGHKGQQDDELAKINRFWDELQDDIRAKLDLHVVYDDKRPWYSTTDDEENKMGNTPYPVNLLRQIAVDCVKTEWLYVTEGDMLTVPNAHQIILDSWQDMMATYDKHSGAGFVVPLYKARIPMDDDQVQTIPKNRQELTTKRISEEYQRSGDVYGNQHLTNFEGWENLPHHSNTYLPYHKSGIESTICDPPDKESEQEPYYIVKKFDLAPYNVLFAGMWWDKTTQIIDACNCGLTFVLHPDLFTIIFDEPENSTKQGAWTMHRANWRQKMIFMTGPVYSQEYQKTQLALDTGRRMCSQVADVPIGGPQPYRPWVPYWLIKEIGTLNRTLRVSRSIGMSDENEIASGKVSLKSIRTPPKKLEVVIRSKVED